MTQKTIGILGLQGDFDKHIQLVNRLGSRAVKVRTTEDLNHCHGLIFPGGESTTIAMLLQRRGLDRSIQKIIQEGMPVFGTCAGLILLAQSIAGRSEFSFAALDIAIERNAYGSQIDSFEAYLDVDVSPEPITSFPAVFIRAPKITSCSQKVQVLAEFAGSPVMLRQNRILASSFHPELTTDGRIHEFFINEICQGYSPKAP